MYDHRSLVILLACVSLVVLGCRVPTAANALEDMLRILPGDTRSVVFVDVNAIYDDDFRPLLEDVEDSWNEYLEDDFDIELTNLTYFAVGGDLFLLGGLGRDDLDNLRSELAFMGYDDDELRDVEVWIDTSESWEAVAFLDGSRVLMAEDEDAMEDALRRMDSEAFSLYDRVGDVVSDIPSEVPRVRVFNASDWSYARTIQKKGSDEIKYVHIALYENEDDVETADDFVEYIRPILPECYDVNAAQHGRKVIFSVVCELGILHEDVFRFLLHSIR